MIYLMESDLRLHGCLVLNPGPAFGIRTCVLFIPAKSWADMCINSYQAWGALFSCSSWLLDGSLADSAAAGSRSLGKGLQVLAVEVSQPALKWYGEDIPKPQSWPHHGEKACVLAGCSGLCIIVHT